MTRQQTTSYTHYKVLSMDHTHKTQHRTSKTSTVTRGNQRTQLIPQTRQYIEQNATTKFIIGLQPQTTTQRFTSTLANQRTFVYRHVPTKPQYPNWHKIHRTEGLIIGTIPTNNTEKRLKSTVKNFIVTTPKNHILLACSTCSR